MPSTTGHHSETSTPAAPSPDRTPSPEGNPPAGGPADAVALDCVVVGGGPAGLQVAEHLQTAGVRLVVCEASDQVGAFFARYPRNRTLISFNKQGAMEDHSDVNLRWDWNSLLSDGDFLPFGEYSQDLYPSADDLVRYLHDYAKQHELPVRLGCRVTRITPVDAEGAPLDTPDEDHGAGAAVEPDGYRVETSEGTYACRYVVVATGMSRTYVPDVPGIELAEDYEDAPLDPESFAGKRVLVLGKGNSAVEVSDRAVETAALVHVASPTPVRLAMRTRHPGGVRMHSARLFDMYQLKLLNSILNCHVLGLERDGDEVLATVSYTLADGERDVLAFDRVIRCTGFRYDEEIYDDSCRPQTRHERVPAMTPTWESPTSPGLFFAGTLMQERDFKGAGSAFIDGFRYNIRTLSRMLLDRYHGLPCPTGEAPGDAGGLADALLRRASTTSALWVQFRHLCDVAVVDPETGRATLHEEWPMQDVPHRWGDVPLLHTLSYVWGTWDGDMFAIERHPDAAQARSSVFLHPVVTRWRYGVAEEEHHVLEDLAGVYHPDHVGPSIRSHNGVPVAEYHHRQHVLPLVDFLAASGLERGDGAAAEPETGRPATAQPEPAHA